MCWSRAYTATGGRDLACAARRSDPASWDAYAALPQLAKDASHHPGTGPGSQLVIEETLQALSEAGVPEELIPVMGLGQCAVHLWMEHRGSASATAGYRVCSDEGRTTHAHGARAVVRLDSTTLRPTPWSDRAREASRTIELPKSSDQPQVGTGPAS